MEKLDQDIINSRLEAIQNLMRQRYHCEQMNGETVFEMADQTLFTLSYHFWSGWNLILVESGTNRQMPRSQWEDDDTYALDEMTDEEIAEAIIRDME